jgi:hypothetical protein
MTDISIQTSKLKNLIEKFDKLTDEISLVQEYIITDPANYDYEIDKRFLVEFRDLQKSLLSLSNDEKIALNTHTNVQPNSGKKCRIPKTEKFDDMIRDVKSNVDWLRKL